MRILVIGSGGREDAIAWKLQQNPRVEEIIIKSSSLSIEELLKIAKEEKIDFTMVGRFRKLFPSRFHLRRNRPNKRMVLFAADS